MKKVLSLMVAVITLCAMYGFANVGTCLAFFVKAKKENVEICWYDEDGEFYPNDDDFSDLCNNVLDELGGIEKIGQKVKNKKKIKVKIYKNIIKDLIKKAEELNYKKLEEMMTKTFNNLINSNEDFYLFEYKYE